MPKLTRGKPVTITLPPYIQSELERLVEQKHLSKSAIIILALEYYARKEEKENAK